MTPDPHLDAHRREYEPESYDPFDPPRDAWAHNLAEDAADREFRAWAVTIVSGLVFGFMVGAVVWAVVR